MIFAKCACCGRNGAKTWYKDKLFCDECINNFGTCHMCEHSVKCEFQTNPAPIPMFVSQHIRQQTERGYVEQITQAPNSKRIKAFCLDVKCVCCKTCEDSKVRCMRQFNTCENYKEAEL